MVQKYVEGNTYDLSIKPLKEALNPICINIHKVKITYVDIAEVIIGGDLQALRD